MPDVLELFDGREFELFCIVQVHLGVLDFTLGSTFCSVFSVRQSDAAVAQFEEEFLHHVLELLDVNKEGALFFHPKLDFRSDLSANRLISSHDGACRRNGAVDFMTNPRNDVRFAV